MLSRLVRYGEGLFVHVNIMSQKLATKSSNFGPVILNSEGVEWRNIPSTNIFTATEWCRCSQFVKIAHLGGYSFSFFHWNFWRYSLLELWRVTHHWERWITMIFCLPISIVHTISCSVQVCRKRMSDRWWPLCISVEFKNSCRYIPASCRTQQAIVLVSNLHSKKQLSHSLIVILLQVLQIVWALRKSRRGFLTFDQYLRLYWPIDRCLHGISDIVRDSTGVLSQFVWGYMCRGKMIAYRWEVVKAVCVCVQFW